MIFVLQAPKDEKHKVRLAFASIFVVSYGIMGMFNILFGHDIIDSLFITGLIFLALSVVKTDGFALEDPVEVKIRNNCNYLAILSRIGAVDVGKNIYG